MINLDKLTVVTGILFVMSVLVTGKVIAADDDGIHFDRQRGGPPQSVVVDASGDVAEISLAKGVASFRPSPSGVWFGRQFFGPPDDPSSPVLDIVVKVDGDGTIIVDTSSQTGAHPLIPFEFTTNYGVWKGIGRNKFVAHQIVFKESLLSGEVSLSIFTSEFSLDNRNHISGVIRGLDLPCEIGAFGEPRCPNPADIKFPVVGDGDLFVDVFPIQLKRIRIAPPGN